MKKCPFCNKINIEKTKIFETKTEYVLYNIRPGKNKGKCIVVPKRHVKNLRELSSLEASNLLKTTKFISQKLNKYLKPAGFNYGLNEGKTSGQTINHLHFHIIPRYKNDGLPKFHIFHRNPKTKKNLPESKLKALVQEFRKLFK